MFCVDVAPVRLAAHGLLDKTKNREPVRAAALPSGQKKMTGDPAPVPIH
jgi:hypothetical protein